MFLDVWDVILIYMFSDALCKVDVGRGPYSTNSRAPVHGHAAGMVQECMRQ